MRTFNAKIIYKVNTNHPDFFWGEDHIMEHIQEDLLLTAGGGYNWKGLSEYKFEIEEVR